MIDSCGDDDFGEVAGVFRKQISAIGEKRLPGEDDATAPTAAASGARFPVWLSGRARTMPS